MQKLIKKGETCYLAIVLPNKSGQQKQQQHQQGMTQKVKRAQMKEKGAIRKPPPVKDTRKRIHSEAPVTVRDELDKILEDYEDMFPEQLPKGRPPPREVEFEIRTEPGAMPPNRPPYRLGPKEHEELQAQCCIWLASGSM